MVNRQSECCKALAMRLDTVWMYASLGTTCNKGKDVGSSGGKNSRFSANSEVMWSLPPIGGHSSGQKAGCRRQNAFAMQEVPILQCCSATSQSSVAAPSAMHTMSQVDE